MNIVQVVCEEISNYIWTYNLTGLIPLLGTKQLLKNGTACMVRTLLQGTLRPLYRALSEPFYKALSGPFYRALSGPFYRALSVPCYSALSEPAHFQSICVRQDHGHLQIGKPWLPGSSHRRTAAVAKYLQVFPELTSFVYLALHTATCANMNQRNVWGFNDYIRHETGHVQHWMMWHLESWTCCGSFSLFQALHSISFQPIVF